MRFREYIALFILKWCLINCKIHCVLYTTYAKSGHYLRFSNSIVEKILQRTTNRQTDQQWDALCLLLSNSERILKWKRGPCTLIHEQMTELSSSDGKLQTISYSRKKKTQD